MTLPSNYLNIFPIPLTELFFVIRSKDNLSLFDSVSCSCLIPEGPVVLAVGLHVSKVEPQTLRDVQHVAEVQTYGVEQHRGHADLIQGPHVVTPA